MAIPEYEFWGSNYYDNPPLTEDAIKVAESQLGVTLPRDSCDFYGGRMADIRSDSLFL